MIEEWRSVVGFETYYEVSSLGRVRSITRIVNGSWGPRKHRGKVLSPSPQKSGHLNVHLSVRGVVKTHRVHTLVAAAFIGPCPHGKQVNHIDAIPANNVPANLEYVTPLENSRHMLALGNFPLGEEHWNHVLSEADVRRARSLRAKGMTFREIVGTIGKSTRRTISRACSGEHWGHVK